MTLTDRISFFLKQRKLTQSQFCKKTGFSKYNLSKFLTGAVKHVKIDLAIVIAENYPEVNLRWLLLEEGEMFNEKNITSSFNLKEQNNQLKTENSELKSENYQLKDKIITLLEKG